MSADYVTVQWNAHKRTYDKLLLTGVAAYLAVFIAIGAVRYTGAHAISPEILVIRACGSAGLLLLHVILCIGPLVRLDRRFLPLLYNRRHMGVTMFSLGLVHALIAVGFYHGFGNLNPLLSLLTSNTNFGDLRQFPFELLGAGGLLILFLLAATSHDFWQKTLSPRAWKTLHMGVYAAYGLLIMHVALGSMQTQRGGLLGPMLLAGCACVAGLHLLAGWRETQVPSDPMSEDWIEAGPLASIPDQAARVVVAGDGTRIAVFRQGDACHGLANVCAHQGGPLGEGRIVDGCVTCPWHGWQYRPTDGMSPPPFTEQVPTYPTRVVDGQVFVRSTPAGGPADA